MKILESLKTDKAQHVFAAAVVILLLLIPPMIGGQTGKYGGGFAMLAGSALGLIAYLLLYGGRLRSCGQLKTTLILIAASFALGAIVTAAFRLIRLHWC